MKKPEHLPSRVGDDLLPQDEDFLLREGQLPLLSEDELVHIENQENPTDAVFWVWGFMNKI